MTRALNAIAIVISALVLSGMAEPVTKQRAAKTSEQSAQPEVACATSDCKDAASEKQKRPSRAARTQRARPVILAY